MGRETCAHPKGSRESSLGHVPDKHKLVLAGLAVLASVALVASPAMAAPPSGPFGDLEIINSTGGTNSSDGLKIHIAQGQIQITRGGIDQLFPTGSFPITTEIDSSSGVNNYFTVAFTNAGTVRTISPPNGPAGAYFEDLYWNSATSSATLTGGGQSGTVVNTLTSEETGDGIVTLEITYEYTYPNEFLNISTKLTLPNLWTYPTRVYWNTDSTLGGADSGDQLEGTLNNGQVVRGVVSPDGTQLEGFRQVVGQNVNSWAGNYRCPWNDQGLDCNPASFNSWVDDNLDAPNSISSQTNVDNGFGVSVPMVNTSGVHTASFDILFVSCVGGVSPLQCIEEAVNPDPAPSTTTTTTTTAAAVALATTGANVEWLMVAGLIAVIAGSGFIAFSRRKRTW
jgi:LPXTG-motif cell wall-anchored protein